MKMNKKLITMLAALGLVGCVGVGSTLAYLTDTTKTVENVFTVGKVDVEIEENFEQNSLLMPVTGSAQDTTGKNPLKGGIKKEVFVKGVEGTQPAYVRVHIAIPNVLDDGDSTFDAAKNVLHFNWSGYDYKGSDNQWCWFDKVGGSNWNYYETTVDGVLYDVYVVTYLQTLEAGETTETAAMNQVYLDKKVTSSDVEKINAKLGDDWKILVAAEAVQAANFDDAYSALNAGFGTPKAETSPFNK